MYRKIPDTRSKRQIRSHERARDYYNDINYDNYRIFCEMNLFYPFVADDYDVTYEDMKTYSEKFQKWKQKHLLRTGVELVELRNDFTQEEVSEIACLAIANEVAEEKSAELEISTLSFDKISISVQSQERTTLNSNMYSDIKIMNSKNEEHVKPKQCRKQKWKRFSELQVAAHLKSIKDPPEKLLIRIDQSEAVFETCNDKRTSQFEAAQHSRFCEIPTLVSELCAQRDTKFKHLLEVHACVTRCDCLSIFRPPDPAYRNIEMANQKRHRRRRFMRRFLVKPENPNPLKFAVYMDRGSAFWLRLLSANVHQDLRTHTWAAFGSDFLHDIKWYDDVSVITEEHKWQCTKGKRRRLKDLSRKLAGPPL